MKSVQLSAEILGLTVLLCAALCLALCCGTMAIAAEPSNSSSGYGALIDTFMAGERQGQGVAVATSVEGGDTTLQFFGVTEPGGSEAVGEQTAFEWGRCSDLIVWACVMQLVERGELALDDSVADLLPEGVVLPEGYTGLDVIDLMNHASGLDVAMVGAASTVSDATTSARAALGLFDVVGEFKPGSIVGYTPYDAVLAAVIVEHLTGVDFAVYVQENVLGRLGLDATYFMVCGSATRLAASKDAPVQAQALAKGISGPQGVSSPRPATSSAFVCFGPVGDLVALANALMGYGETALFDDEQTVGQLFTVTRTYPSLGVARIAHGLFAFPFSDGVFGISGTTSTGFSASVYMDRLHGCAIAVLVNQSGRADLTQGVTRVVVGRSDAVVADVSSPANALWTGTYQDAGRANHGPSKLLTALERIQVGLNDQGVLTFDGVTTASLGAGVYSSDTAIDQDVYRFHVSLERGAEFSRVTSDSYSVSVSTLAIENALLVGAAACILVSLSYAVSVVWRWLRVRSKHRRCALQTDVALLAALNVAAGILALIVAAALVEGLLPAALNALLMAEAAYLVVGSLVALWVAVTRWRGTLWTRGQNIAAAVMLCCFFGLAMNLLYWEMLP